MKKICGVIAALLLACAPVTAAETVKPLIWPGNAVTAAPVDLAAQAKKRAPAPGLSSVRVYAVSSDNHPGWEYPSVGQISSPSDHGGYVYIAVYERGYGSNYPVAKMAGATLPASANYQSQTICAEVGATIYRCAAGQTVIGWLKYWKTQSVTSGTFTYSNSSLSGTSPTYGTKSLSFFVK